MVGLGRGGVKVGLHGSNGDRRWSGKGKGQRLGLGGSWGGEEDCWGFNLGKKESEGAMPRRAELGGHGDGGLRLWRRELELWL